MGHKYRLQKKVKAHHRKLKKLAKKGGFLHPRKQKPFELNIPKSWPHKEAMLKEVLAEKKDAEARRSDHRVMVKEKKKQKKKEKEAKPDSDEEI